MALSNTTPSNTAFSTADVERTALTHKGQAPQLAVTDILDRQPACVDGMADWLEPLRQAAVNRVRPMAFPTMRDEDWRFTNLAALKAVQFGTATTDSSAKHLVGELDIPESRQTRLVFVNGCFSSELSDLSGLPVGVTAGSLAALNAEQQELVRSYFTIDAAGAKDAFALLNSACLTDVAVVHVARNCAVSVPIQIAFVSVPGVTPTISHPRCAIVLERGSSSTIVEQFLGGGDAAYLANAVTEISLADNAQLEHCKWQAEADDSFHVARTAISQAQDSRYIAHTISTGAQLSRHTLETVQQGTNVQTTLNGLTIATDSQMSDTHTTIDHANPHGTSNQVHKCIVGDRAHTVFNGKVIVRPHAQKIDSSQSSRNLLLSDKARVDTKPQLEIFADDVKCAHGATVSQLMPDEVFYLQSRGLDLSQAKQLLTYAFAAEAIEKISVRSVSNRLKTYAMSHSSFEN